MLLAVMSVLVFVLPLYQLLLGLRNPVKAVSAKAAQSFRDIRRRLRGGSGAAIPAGPDVPEAGGREQARLHGRTSVSSSVCGLAYGATMGCSEGRQAVQLCGAQGAPPVAEDRPVNQVSEEVRF